MDQTRAARARSAPPRSSTTYMPESERGKFNFDHHFAFLTNFLKRQNFLLSGFLFGRRIIFKKNVSKTLNRPSLQICKIGLRNTLLYVFIFGRKNGRVLFVAILCRILAYFCYLIKALIELRKMLLRKQLFDARFGNCSTHKVPRICIFTGFTKMQLT